MSHEPRWKVVVVVVGRKTPGGFPHGRMGPFFDMGIIFPYGNPGINRIPVKKSR